MGKLKAKKMTYQQKKRVSALTEGNVDVLDYLWLGEDEYRIWLHNKLGTRVIEIDKVTGRY